MGRPLKIQKVDLQGGIQSGIDTDHGQAPGKHQAKNQQRRLRKREAQQKMREELENLKNNDTGANNETRTRNAKNEDEIKRQLSAADWKRKKGITCRYWKQGKCRKTQEKCAFKHAL